MERRRGLFEDLMDIGLKLPLKVASAAAVVIYVGLHVVAIETQAPVTTKTLAGVGAVVQHEFLHAFAEFLQYLVPPVLVDRGDGRLLQTNAFQVVADNGAC